MRFFKFGCQLPADCAVLICCARTTLVMSNINIQPDNMDFMIFPDHHRRGNTTSPEREISFFLSCCSWCQRRSVPTRIRLQRCTTSLCQQPSEPWYGCAGRKSLRSLSLKLGVPNLIMLLRRHHNGRFWQILNILLTISIIELVTLARRVTTMKSNFRQAHLS